MKLHTHPEEFRELITVVANEKHISESAVERDYYIVMMLKSLADSPETSCQGLFIKKISNSIICCTMLVVYVIWLYN